MLLLLTKHSGKNQFLHTHTCQDSLFPPHKGGSAVPKEKLDTSLTPIGDDKKHEETGSTLPAPLPVGSYFIRLKKYIDYYR